MRLFLCAAPCLEGEFRRVQRKEKNPDARSSIIFRIFAQLTIRFLLNRLSQCFVSLISGESSHRQIDIQNQLSCSD